MSGQILSATGFARGWQILIGIQVALAVFLTLPTLVFAGKHQRALNATEAAKEEVTVAVLEMAGHGADMTTLDKGVDQGMALDEEGEKEAG